MPFRATTLVERPARETSTSQSKTGASSVAANWMAPNTSKRLPGVSRAPSSSIVPWDKVSLTPSEGISSSAEKDHAASSKPVWASFPARSTSTSPGTRVKSPRSGVFHASSKVNSKVMSFSKGAHQAPHHECGRSPR